MKKRLLSVLMVLCMVLTLLPVSAFAYSGTYGNASFSDQEGYFYTAGNDLVYGWKVAINNRNAGSVTSSFVLWFPDPTEVGSTYRGHVRYTAGEHGTGSYEEELPITYHESNYNYGYELYTLPSEEELEGVGIEADVGYVFDHYEITYWNRNNSTDTFTETTGTFYPNDVFPYDRNLSWNYETTQGYLEIKVIYAEDPQQPTIPDDSEVDFTHEVYIPAGYDCGMTFNLTSGASLSNLQVVSANPQIATIKGELIDNNTTASVTIDALMKGETAVYCMFDGGYTDPDTVEKILVHVYDPDQYQVSVMEGESEEYIHRVTLNNGTLPESSILFDMVPQINSGDSYVTIPTQSDYDWIKTIEDSAAVVIPITGKAEGDAIIETQFGFLEDTLVGDAIHLFVDVVNVTVTEATTPPPTEDPSIDNFTKERVTTEPTDGKIGDVTLTLGDVTVNYNDPVVIPNGGDVTLMYKLTVTGDEGAAFQITDQGAKLVGSNCSASSGGQAGDVIYGNIPDGGQAVIYVIKTFDGEDIDTNGELTNTATIAPGEGTDLGTDVGTATDGGTDASEEPAPPTGNPMDGITVTKEAVIPGDKETAEVGNTLEYTITISNRCGGSPEIRSSLITLLLM